MTTKPPGDGRNSAKPSLEMRSAARGTPIPGGAAYLS